MTAVAMALTAAMLAGPGEMKILQAELKLTRAENKALKQTVTRLGNENIWLKDEVVRLKKVIEKLEAKLAGLCKQVKQDEQDKQADPDDPGYVRPIADLTPATFGSFEAIIEAYPEELYPKGSQRGKRNTAQARAMDWFRKELVGKTAVISAKVRAVQVPTAGKKAAPQIRATSPTKDVTVGGRTCSWQCAYLDARLDPRDAGRLKGVKAGDTVTVHGRISSGMINISRMVTPAGKIAFSSRVVLTLTGCRLVKVTPAKRK